MKKAMLTMAALVLGGGVARAQMTAAEKPSPADHQWKAMDANADGKVSPEEHETSAGRMFATMDADRNGTVTAAEMTAAHDRVTGKKRALGEMSAVEKIKVVDSNADGTLTVEEHRAGARAMFERMDTNKDGFLSPDELAAGQAMKMRK